jgi:hypothetical protein
MNNKFAIGDAVLLLELPSWLLHDLPISEQNEMKSYIGQSTKIENIDSYGYIWISFGNSQEVADAGGCSGHSFCITAEFLKPTNTA